MTVIKGNNSAGFGLNVDTNGRALVNSPLIEHFASDFDGDFYTVGGTETPAASTVQVLHIENTDTTGKELVVTNISLHYIDVTGAAAADYFSITTGELYSSTGTAVVPKNLNFGSTNAVTGKFYENGPTLTGTATEIFRWYVAAEGTFKEIDTKGSIILPQNTALTVKFTSDETSGDLRARINFFMRKSLSALLV